MRSRIYDDTDGGDSRPDDFDLYRGPPYGVQLICGLYEHDSGDQDMVANLFKKAAEVAAQKGKDACGNQGGAEVAELCKIAWDGYIKDVGNTILDDIFGVADDKITTWNWNISAKDMVRMCRQGPQNFWGIEYHLESHLLEGDGADYKIYLDVRALWG